MQTAILEAILILAKFLHDYFIELGENNSFDGTRNNTTSESLLDPYLYTLVVPMCVVFLFVIETSDGGQRTSSLDVGRNKYYLA